MTSLLECRAGKMKLVGTELPDGSKRYQLEADPRKGLLRLAKSEDSLMHVLWFERLSTGSASIDPEADVIIFPSEATFEKVPNQRVLALKFRDEPERNLFFWLQEPHGDDDEARRARFNAAINDATDFVAEAPGPSHSPPPSSALERAHTSDVVDAGQEVVAGPTVGLVPSAPGQGIMEASPLLQPSGGGSTSAAASLAQLLSDALAGAGRGSGGAGGSSGLSLLAGVAAQQRGQQRAQEAAGPSLTDLLKPDVLLPILRDPQALERLSPYLPEEHRNPEALLALAHCPQFHQQLNSLSDALQSGQLDLAQFGLRSQGFGAVEFLSAIMELVQREGGTSSGAAPPSAAPGGDQAGPGAGGPAPMQD